MDKKETAVIIDGQKYRYVANGWTCRSCALYSRCSELNDCTMCDIVGKADDENGNFQLVEEGEAQDIEGHVCEPQGYMIDEATYKRLEYLGILDSGVRAHNVGKSDYSRRFIQPWSIWLEYELDPWDADIVKRVLRTKDGEPRQLDYEKIIHVCEERIRQLKTLPRPLPSEGGERVADSLLR